MNKKGLTPLVATILLVAFSVGLGAIVMSWGEEYIEEKADFAQGTAEIKTDCDSSAIDIIRIGGQPQLCQSSEKIQIWLENSPNTDLYNVHAILVGEEDVQTIESILTEPLLKSNADKLEINFNPTIGKIKQIKLTPKIWTGTEVVTCSQRSLTIENIPNC